ncbi:MAG TPA: hypothetical protein VGR28_03175 [Candidatus Thermoplasmatota archaeon]|jgi:hypothetical protein|nr:hypothetical protein [Candidatus Thermoplasmatota archaeon]
MRNAPALAAWLALAITLAGCASTSPAPMNTTEGTPPGPPPPPPTKGTLRVHAIDVGPGQATVVELPQGHVLLMGCGPRAGSGDDHPVVQALRDRFGQPPGGHLLGLVVPSAAPGVAGGCADVLEFYFVDHLYDAWVPGGEGNATFAALRERVRGDNGTVHALVANDTLGGGLPFGPNATIQLPADEEDSGGSLDLLAAPSPQGGLALRLRFGEASFCWLGSLAASQDAALALNATLGACAVVLAGAEVPSAALLQRAAPKVAALSVGRNLLAQPDAGSLCRIEQTGARLLLTHRAGDIDLATEGQDPRVRPMQAEPGRGCGGQGYWMPDGAPAGAPGTLQVHLGADAGAACAGRPATVQVRVADEDGAPVADANLTARWDLGDRWPTDHTATDDQGGAELSRQLDPASAGAPVVLDVRVVLGEEWGLAMAALTPCAA